MRKLGLRLLLVVSLASVGLAGGAWVAGRFLVPEGSGLAAGPIALVYGLVGALMAAIMGLWLGLKIKGRALAVLVLACVTAAVAVYVGLYIAYTRLNPSRDAESVSPKATTRPARRQPAAITNPRIASEIELEAQVPGLSCAATARRHAVRIGGEEEFDDGAEVYGTHLYAREVGPGWVFMLQPQVHGWSIRLYDRHRSDQADADAVDLSQITPPFRVGVNHRDIAGWHFRNAANTGPNLGDVNAPQQRRLFVFSPELAGTGGFKPSGNGAALQEALSTADGRGWLHILDYGLSDLEPGQKARMTYLRFETCLSWPRSEEEGHLVEQ